MKPEEDGDIRLMPPTHRSSAGALFLAHDGLPVDIWAELLVVCSTTEVRLRCFAEQQMSVCYPECGAFLAPIRLAGWPEYYEASASPQGIQKSTPCSFDPSVIKRGGRLMRLKAHASVADSKWAAMNHQVHQALRVKRTIGWRTPTRKQHGVLNLKDYAKWRRTPQSQSVQQTSINQERRCQRRWETAGHQDRDR